MTSVQSIKCMATHKEKHIKHNGIIGFLAKLGDTWPTLTIAQMTVKWSAKHEFQKGKMFSPHYSMASMNTKYSMAPYMTCPPPWVTNVHD